MGGMGGEQKEGKKERKMIVDREKDRKKREREPIGLVRTTCLDCVTKAKAFHWF